MSSSSPSYAAFSTPIDRYRAFVVPSATRANLPLRPSFRLIKSSSRLINLRCNSNGDSGENVCKNVLDAFFLGKAIGEVVNERIESSLDEFLGLIATLQAQQLKHMCQFQEEVLEKATRAKEEAMGGARVLASKAASTAEEATEAAQALVSEAASTVREATQEAIHEAAATTEQAMEGLVTRATSTFEEAAHSTEGLTQATGKAEELISDATSKATDVSKTIISETSSSLLNPTKDGSFLRIFKD